MKYPWFFKDRQCNISSFFIGIWKKTTTTRPLYLYVFVELCTYIIPNICISVQTQRKKYFIQRTVWFVFDCCYSLQENTRQYIREWEGKSGNMTKWTWIKCKWLNYYLIHEPFCLSLSDFQRRWWLFNNKEKNSRDPTQIMSCNLFELRDHLAAEIACCMLSQFLCSSCQGFVKVTGELVDLL